MTANCVHSCASGWSRSLLTLLLLPLGLAAASLRTALSCAEPANGKAKAVSSQKPKAQLLQLSSLLLLQLWSSSEHEKSVSLSPASTSSSCSGFSQQAIDSSARGLCTTPKSKLMPLDCQRKVEAGGRQYNARRFGAEQRGGKPSWAVIHTTKHSRLQR
jgi:hypothetical protein